MVEEYKNMTEWWYTDCQQPVGDEFVFCFRCLTCNKELWHAEETWYKVAELEAQEDWDGIAFYCTEHKG